MPLRQYQCNCINCILSRRQAGVRRQLVIAATGTGKGNLFAELPKHARPGKRTMMLVHTIDLVEQGAKRIHTWNEGLDVGIEMGDVFAGDQTAVVASVQTLGREGSKRLQAFTPSEFDWLAIDEGHHATSDSYGRVIDHFLDDPASDCTLIGFTATPNRADGTPMGQVFDEIVFNYPIEQAIRDGWLVDIRAIRVKTEVDLSKVHSRDGEYVESELEEAINTPRRNELVAKAWVENCYPRKTVVFALNVKHAQDLAKAFQKLGVPCEAVWGSDPKRKAKMEAFDKDLLQVMVNVKLLTEGWDNWRVSCVVPACPHRSQGKLIQEVGRATRIDPDIGNLVEARAAGRIKHDTKVDCLVMDVCDTTVKHSLATVPSLFGLNSNLDLKGQSVMGAVKKLEDVQNMYPDLDLTKLEDITKLKTYVEEANLWTVTFCSEVTEVSNLQWHRAADSTYRLLLPAKEMVVVKGDLLGKFHVTGRVTGTVINKSGFESLAEAISYAEKQITTLAKSLLTLLRRESGWHSQPKSEGQIKMLKMFKVPAAVYSSWTKGDAARFITKKLGEKR